MKKRTHATILPSLEEALERVKRQRITEMNGLAGESRLSDGVPEFDHPHEVSHTHPFTSREDDE